MQSTDKDEEPITAINVTPLVDVSLVLVIILMVTTPMMSQSKLSVTLPKAATDEAKNEEYVTITINKKGDTSVNEKQVFTPKELEQVLMRKLAGSSDKVVIIKADLEVDHGTVIDAMDVAKKVKPKKIFFATQMNKNKDK
jgi:biopolymer transport protein ExbD